MTPSDEHLGKVDRLWRAIRRDYFTAVEYVAGLNVDQGKAAGALKRIRQNWEDLCRHDLEVASRLFRGFEAMSGNFSRLGEPDSPVDHRRRQFEEMLGVMEIGREANPEVEVETTGDLFRLGQEEIQRQIEDDFGD